MAVEDKIKNLLDMLDGYGYQYKLFDGKVVVENHSSDIIRAVEILEEFSKYNLIPMYRTTSFKKRTEISLLFLYDKTRRDL